MLRTRWLASGVAVVSAVLITGFTSVDAGTSGAPAVASGDGATGSLTQSDAPAASITAIEAGRVQISARADVRQLSLVWFGALAAVVLTGAAPGRSCGVACVTNESTNAIPSAPAPATR